MKLEQVILRDTRANQPAASAVPTGTLYCVTDESNLVERSTGAAWEPFGTSGTGTGDVTGPGSSVDNEIVRFSGAGGTSIDGSGITIADGASGTLAGTNTGDVTLGGTPNYITLAGQVITRNAVDLSTHVTGDLPLANVAPASAASRILGRGAAAGAGDWQELTLGSGVSLSGTTLTATGAGGDVVGPASATDGYLAVFDGVSGKIIKSGGAAPTGTNTGDVTLAGTPDYLTIVGQAITRNAVDLAADVTGDLPLTNLAPSSAASRLLGRGSAAGGGDYQEVDLGTGLTMTGTTLAASGLVSSADLITLGRYGFVDLTETTYSFNDTTYEFTLTSVGASWRYWRAGVLYTITGNKSVTFTGTPPANGQWFVFIDATNGTLSASQSAWTLLDSKVPVALVVWNPSNTPKYWISDERHTCLIDRRDHYVNHATIGARYISGGVPADYVVPAGAPASDDDNTYSVSEATFADEDLIHTLSQLTDPSGSGGDYVKFTRTGGSTWTWAAADVPYDHTSSGYINYDASGTMTEGQAAKYYTSYLLLTSFDGAARFVVINGRSEFANLAAAQAESPAAFTWTGFPVAECVIAYQFVWQTNNSYTTKGKCRLAATPRRISATISSAAISTSADHNGLAGLQGGQATEYYHLTAAEYVVAQDAVVGPDTSTDNGVPRFDSTGGHTLQTSGLVIDDSDNVTGVESLAINGTLTANTKLTVTGQVQIPLVAAGNSGATKTIDWADGNEQYLTLTASCVLTFSNPVDGGRYVLLVNSGAGSFTLTFPATVQWAGGTAPVMTATASRVDLFTFIYVSTLTTYFGSFNQSYSY